MDAPAEQVEVTSSGGVTWLELAAPEKANCLSMEMIKALERAMIAAAARAPVVAIRAQGRHFCAGFDVRATTPQAPRFLRLGRLLELMRDLDAITVAVVQGKAIGGGADLACHCDIRVALADSSFQFPGFRKFGVLLGTDRLVELAGPLHAMEAMTRDRVFEVETARQVGLVDVVCESREQAFEYVENWGSAVLDVPRASLTELISMVRASGRLTSGLSDLARSLVTAGLR